VAELPELTLAYLQQRPESAARALEGLLPADAAEVVRRTPARLAAPVVGAMSSVRAAQCAAQLPADVAAALCAALSWPDAAALLRRLDGAARERVLEELPEKTARRFRRSLDYPDDVVGAWIEFEVPAIPEDRAVGDAVRLLEQSPNYAGSHLLLTDAAQRYRGAVRLAALLTSAATAALAALAQDAAHPLRDAASLASVAEHPGWEVATLLPVVNHRGELLGGLTRQTLRKALRQTAPGTRDAVASLPAEMLKAYLLSGEGLLRLLVQGAVDERRREPGRQA
jgi:magnesium transporter